VDRHRRFDTRKAASTLLTYQRDRTLGDCFPNQERMNKRSERHI
jgi:hypothetical protein